MANERQRLLELALESLVNKKASIDAEIAAITRELRRGEGKTPAPVKAAKPAGRSGSAKPKRARFSKEERVRRSQRMKAYWDNWRKQKNRQK